MNTNKLNIEVSANESKKASMIIKHSDLENRFVCLVSQINPTLWTISFDCADNAQSERARLLNAMQFNLTIGGVQEFKFS
ncbi:MAG: hypothetical protein ACK5QC_15970 [Bacteroidota bacterium]